jgi:hypothetical protein
MTAADPKERHVPTVAVLALDQVIPFDLSTPLEIFGRVRLPGGRYPYNVGVCAPAPEVGSRGFAIARPGRQAALSFDSSSRMIMRPWEARANPLYIASSVASSSSSGGVAS